MCDYLDDSYDEIMADQLTLIEKGLETAENWDGYWFLPDFGE
jgi:hypothetical protein